VAEATINQWASDQTHGRINGIANGLIDPDYTDLVLANAIYFKGKWQDPFDKNATQSRPFHPATGPVEQRDLMEKTDTFSYRRGTGYNAVRIPYMGGDVAMYVFLPDPGTAPEKLVGLLNGDRWRRITVPGFSDYKVHLVLPKFRLEDTLELVDPLEKLGIKRAFDSTNADFSGMFTKPHYVSEVRQKTFVQTDEEGTEAAAVTMAPLPLPSGIPAPEPPPIELIVDRPFLFTIVDARTGLILFLGVVNEIPGN
jgi:serpin B